ncbi:hypothetical protein CLOP_g6907 [Closterium sp. NIES-67]|nr:hypothetical protein CLOP_g6907 [Closterium sp. NIES-67]
MEDEADSPLLRFLIELLKPISEADPALLANYVVALLKNSKPHDELRQLCLDQLQDFLTDETEGFVTKLFDALERGEISLEDAEAEGDEPGGADDTDKKKSRGEDAEPAEANEGGRDGGRGGGKSGGSGEMGDSGELTRRGAGGEGPREVGRREREGGERGRMRIRSGTTMAVKAGREASGSRTQRRKRRRRREQRRGGGAGGGGGRAAETARGG